MVIFLRVRQHLRKVPWTGSVALLLTCCLLFPHHSAAVAAFKPVNHTKGLCLWYGQCENTALGWQNCYNNTPARSVDPDSDVYQLVEELCPWYAKGKDTKICCDKNMLQTLKDTITPAKILLQRCPSCFTDFMKLFCATTCDPDAASFMDVYELFWNPSTNAIEQVEVYMTYDFADILYDACKNVQSSQQGGPVIGYLCGTSAANCNGEKWLTFMGDPKEGSPTPFTLKYHFYNTTAPLNDSGPQGITPHNTSMLHCYDRDTYSGDVRCHCIDCPTWCTVVPAYNLSCMNACSIFDPPHPPISEQRVLPARHIDCTVVPLDATSIVVWGLLCAAITLGLVVFCRSPAREKDGFEQGGAKDDNLPHKDREKCSLPHSNHFQCQTMKNIVEKVFQLCKLLTARCWCIAIFCGLIVVLFLVLSKTGTNRLVQLTTLGSQHVRVEYAASNILAGAPHRSAQLIITTSMSYTTYSINSESGPGIIKTIGPVFNMEVMLEVLWLQNNLTAMKVPFGSGPNATTIALSDICFKPVNDYCIIPSVLQYFQNSQANLEYNRTSLLYGLLGTAKSHVDYCLSAPWSTNASDTFKPCLSQFGAASLPYAVVSQYHSAIPWYYSQYDNATALLVTFVFDEEQKPEEPSPMVATWEKAFYEFVEKREFKFVNVSFRLITTNSTIPVLYSSFCFMQPFKCVAS